MPLGDVGAFHEWVAREDPLYSLVAAVESWIGGLDGAPWQSPSAPIDELSVAGDFQTREAVVSGVEILYQEHYASGRVDLIDVRTYESRPDG